METDKKGFGCALCGEDKPGEPVDMYAGGYVGHAHASCARIGKNAIHLYEQHILFTKKLLPEYLRRKKRTKAKKN